MTMLYVHYSVLIHMKINMYMYTFIHIDMA